MFNLSECVIKFQDSRAYCRLILVLDGLAVFFTQACGLPIWVKGFLIFLMLVLAVRTYLNPKPYPNLDVLTLRAGVCHLILKNNTVELYTHCRVLVNCGLFFLLALSDEKAKRVLVVFFDQIELDCYRTICFLEKIQ